MMNTSYNNIIGVLWSRAVKAYFFSFLIAFLAVFFFSGAAYAQQEITVTGQVTDENGDPLPGATVVVEGTEIGTTTDMDGVYVIDVGQDAILVFSFIGYETRRLTIEGRERIDVQMILATSSLDELVVIGFGETSRRLLTTSISQIDGEQLERVPISNISEGLKGKVGGVRIFDRSGVPGQEPIIEIRGGSSINRSNAPLVLVDGVERPLADLNPSDIGNITVLKDAASTAIYGSRASNGVILITTKRGQTNQPPRITFETNTGFQKRIQQYDLMNAEEFVTFSRANVHPNHPNYVRYINGNNSAPSGGNTESSIFSTRYLQPGEVVPAGWQSIQDPIDPSRTLIFQDTNFEDLMFRTGLWQNYNLNVTGGTDRINYRAGLGYTDDEGIALSSGWNRLSARVNTDIRVREDLIFSSDLSYSESSTKLFGNQHDAIARGAHSVPPTHRNTWEDGTPVHGFNRASPPPLFYDHIHENSNNENHFSFGGKLDWIIGDRFQLIVDGRRYGYNQERSEFENANFFDNSRPASFQSWNRNRTHFDGHIRYFDQISDHSFSIMAGLSYMDTDLLQSNVQAFGASTDKVKTLNASSEISNASTIITEEVLIGSFGRVTYDYNGKYLLTAVFRADGSSRFAESNRWGFFPGASAAWIISDEPFLKNNNTISLLKLRTSFGLTGNNSVGLFDAFGVFNANQPYAGNAGIRATTMPNHDLRWETTRQLDVGLDFGLFNDRIIVAADYFNKLTDDLLFTVPLPNTSGFNNITQNVGQVKYEGFEVEVFSRIIETDRFSWSSNLNLGFVQNEVVKLPDNGRGGNRIGGFVDSNGNEFGGIAEGESLGRIYGFKASHIIETQEQLDNAHFDQFSPGWSPIDGSFQTGRKSIGDMEWVDRDGDGRITTADQFNLGNEIPHTTGGLTNRFQYKNWSLNIALDWAIGHSIVDMNYNMTFLGNFQNNFALSRELLNSWQEPGDKTKWPKWQPINFQLNSNYRPDATNSLFTTKADYLAVREITLGHDISTNLTRRIGAERISIYASVNNLHYFTRVKGVTPEFGTRDNRRQDAANQGYPMVRRVTFGVQLTF